MPRSKGRTGRSSTTFRVLLLAWSAIAAVLVVAWLLRLEDEPRASAVAARYERQPPPRAVLGAAEPAPVASADAAAVTTDDDTAAASSAVLCDLRLPEGTAQLHGRITARETGEPVAGVRVDLVDEGWRGWTATSGADGAYEIGRLPAGVYTLQLSSSLDADVIDDGRSEVPHLKDGEARRLDLTVTRAGRVWGVVTDFAGKPIKNAKVVLGTGDSLVTQFATLAASQKKPLGEVTDEEGRYAIHGVPFEREWLCWVDEEAHAPVLSPPFVLHATRPQVRIDVKLLEGTRITGRVLETSRQPIGGAKVICVPRFTALLAPMRRAPTARETTSKTDGSFELDGVPAGDYQVLAFKDGYRVELKGVPVYPDGASPIDDLVVTLRPVMEGDHVVFGSVRDTEGRPVAGARVGLATVGIESLSFGGRESDTGADGTFRFEGVGEGQFLLVADKTGFRHATETVNADQEVRVALARRSDVSGVVQKPDGTAAEAFSVRVVRRASDEGSASLLDHIESLDSARVFEDNAGKFALEDVAPGRVLLEAKMEGFAPARIEVDVPRGRSVSDVVLRLSSRGATIRGLVTTANGAAVKDATVTRAEAGDATATLALVGDPTGRGSRSVATDERGAFVFERLAEARYQLRVTHSTFAPTTVTVAARSDATVDVSAVLQAGGTIKGRAKPGVMVTVAGDAFSHMVASDEAGAFEVPRVPAGTYLLRALVVDEKAITRAPEVQRRSLQVAEGQVTTVDLLDESAPGRTYQGRVAAPPKGGVGMVLLRVPGSPAPDPASVVFQGQLGVHDGEASRFVVAEGLVAADGTFVLGGVPPGRYTQDVFFSSVLDTLAGKKATLKESKEVVVE